MIDPLVLELLDAGLQRHAHALSSLALPCLHLRVADTAAGDWPPGTSKLGGAPDVPDGFDWPEWQELPLAFLGQIDLAAAAIHPASRELPAEGLLSFFYHPQQTAWGYDPNDRGSGRVYWFPNARELRRARLPDRLPREGRFDAGRLELREGRSLPPYESLDVEALSMSPREHDAYVALWEEWQDRETRGPRHQLLGHPSPVQDEMQLECQLASNGIDCGSSEMETDPRRAELEPGARDWRLLFQLDSDDKTDMMWGDVGMLYFWITASELAARRFERSWLILQCH